MGADSEPGGLDADLLLRALRRVAEDPARWDSLLDLLPPDRGAEHAPHAGLDLSAIEAAAERERRPGEGEDPGGSEDLAWMVVSARGVVLARNVAWAEALMDIAEAEPGAALRWRSPDNAASAETAFRAVRDRGAQVVVRLERGSGEGACFAIACPAARAPGAPAADQPGAVCLLAPAADPASRVWRALRESFDLTDAEIRLARRLRDGLSLQQAAERLGVSVNTVRNQLRSVFDKMGVQRQSDLVRALTELASLGAALEPAAAPVAAEPPELRTLVLGDGRRLTYREYGRADGRPVLNLHEGGGSCLLPPGSDARARELGLRVVSVDRPGFGGSDRAPGYSFAGVGADLAEACAQLGLDGVAISAVASATPFALQAAHRLGASARLVLISSGRPPRRTRGGHAVAELRSRFEIHPWVAEAMFAIIRARRSAPLIHRLLRRVAAGSPGDMAFLEAEPWAADYVCAYAGEALGKANRGPVDEIRAFRTDTSDPPGVACPVVVWHGAEDAISPLDDLLAYLADLKPEVRIVEGAGHLMAMKHSHDMMRRLAAAWDP